MSREGCHGPAAVAATSGSLSETGIPIRLHCKHDPIYVFPEMKLRAASFPISTFMDLCAIYIFPRIHECGNWKRGRAVSFLGIFVSNFRYSVFAVWLSIGFFYVKEKQPYITSCHEMTN